MKEVNKQQAINLERLLRNENKRPVEFSRIVHIPEPTISNWRRGKHEISVESAKKIHAEFPAYDLDFILGHSEYPNKQSEVNAKAAKEQSISRCIESLAIHRGFRVSSFGEFDPNEIDMDAWRASWPNVDRNGIEYVVRVESASGETLKLSADQWDAFADEVCSYVQMRLDAMLERGAW